MAIKKYKLGLIGDRRYGSISLAVVFHELYYILKNNVRNAPGAYVSLFISFLYSFNLPSIAQFVHYKLLSKLVPPHEWMLCCSYSETMVRK